MVNLSDLQNLGKCYYGDPAEDHYIFTGKGLRNEVFHLGHWILYSKIAKISKEGNIPVYMQISSDEKRMSRNMYSKFNQIKELEKKALEQLSTIEWGDISIFSNIDDQTLTRLKPCADYVGSFIKVNKIKGVFGNVSLSTAYYVAMQLAPLVLLGFESEKGKTPVIITSSDQLPFFQIYRDICPKLGLPKPLIVIVDPLMNLKMTSKMSSSDPSLAVPFTEEGFKRIKKAISGSNSFCDHLRLMMSNIIDLPKHQMDSTTKDQIIKVLTTLLSRRSELRVEPFNVSNKELYLNNN